MQAGDEQPTAGGLHVARRSDVSGLREVSKTTYGPGSDSSATYWCFGEIRVHTQISETVLRLRETISTSACTGM
jgi:hypothetical protein